jgi:hypothetical protein
MIKCPYKFARRDLLFGEPVILFFISEFEGHWTSGNPVSKLLATGTSRSLVKEEAMMLREKRVCKNTGRIIFAARLPDVRVSLKHPACALGPTMHPFNSRDLQSVTGCR